MATNKKVNASSSVNASSVNTSSVNASSVNAPSIEESALNEQFNEQSSELWAVEDCPFNEQMTPQDFRDLAQQIKYNLEQIDFTRNHVNHFSYLLEPDGDPDELETYYSDFFTMCQYIIHTYKITMSFCAKLLSDKSAK